jgi:hypothetical protein
MQRRELIKWIVAVTGSAFVGADPLLAAAMPSAPSTAYTGAEVALFDEIAETILPRTDTPGAKDAKVGSFIARYSSACYTAAQIASLHAGLAALDVSAHKRFGTGFLHARPAQRQALLEEIDREAKHAAKTANGDSSHWFTMCKQLTLYGFFSSEPGATKVARDRPIPGKYHGRVPYKGETFWA